VVASALQSARHKANDRTPAKLSTNVVGYKKAHAFTQQHTTVAWGYHLLPPLNHRQQAAA